MSERKEKGETEEIFREQFHLPGDRACDSEWRRTSLKGGFSDKVSCSSAL